MYQRLYVIRPATNPGKTYVVIKDDGAQWVGTYTDQAIAAYGGENADAFPPRTLQNHGGRLVSVVVASGDVVSERYDPSTGAIDDVQTFENEMSMRSYSASRGETSQRFDSIAAENAYVSAQHGSTSTSLGGMQCEQGNCDCPQCAVPQPGSDSTPNSLLVSQYGVGAIPMNPLPSALVHNNYAAPAYNDGTMPPGPPAILQGYDSNGDFVSTIHSIVGSPAGMLLIIALFLWAFFQAFLVSGRSAS